jgi:hypothetical protein
VQPTNELPQNRYFEIAYEPVRGLVEAVINGADRRGHINLFKKLDEDVMYPPLWMARAISARIWRQLSQLIDSDERIANYSWDISIKEFSTGEPIKRATLYLTYAPLDPGTNVRTFTPADEGPKPEES